MGEEINYKALKKKLERGDMTIIALAVNITPQAVSLQFRGENEITEEVIHAALTLINSREAKRKAFNSQIKNL